MANTQQLQLRLIEQLSLRFTTLLSLYSTLYLLRQPGAFCQILANKVASVSSAGRHQLFSHLKNVHL